jgi:hypothetical protein
MGRQLRQPVRQIRKALRLPKQILPCSDIVPYQGFSANPGPKWRELPQLAAE